MYCKKCAHKLSDTALFCPKCGTPVESKFSKTDIKKEELVPKQKPSTHRKKVWVIVLCAAIVVILLLTLLVVSSFFMKNNARGNKDGKVSASSTVNSLVEESSSNEVSANSSTESMDMSSEETESSEGLSLNTSVGVILHLPPEWENKISFYTYDTPSPACNLSLSYTDFNEAGYGGKLMTIMLMDSQTYNEQCSNIWAFTQISEINNITACWTPVTDMQGNQNDPSANEEYINIKKTLEEHIYDAFEFNTQNNDVIIMYDGIYSNMSKEPVIQVEDAINMVTEYLSYKYVPSNIECDHIEGDDYIIHAYDIVSDHTSTTGWYSVNMYTGKMKNIILNEELN